jgi:hypothetical protein
MRIKIEIEDDQGTATTVRTSGDAVTPPPELLAAAEALGATSAGPAPDAQAFTATNTAELPQAEFAQLVASSIDAGSAPEAPASSRRTSRTRGRTDDDAS